MADQERDERSEIPADEPSETEGPPREHIEFEDAVSELESVESSRRRLFAALGIGGLVLLVGTVIVIAEFNDWFFEPRMPIEKSQRAIIRKTDDPQCRELIAEVTNIANTFFAMESRIEANVPGERLEEIRNLDRELATLKQRLDDAEKLGERANLRFEDSRKELDRWFDYVDNEIWVLRDVMDNQMKELGAHPGETGTESDAGDVAPGSSDTSSPDAGGEPDVSSEASEDRGRSPTERRNGALVALHDAFENFRVWHTADLHPCGDDAKGEQPWRPDDWNHRPDAGAARDGG